MSKYNRYFEAKSEFIMHFHTTQYSSNLLLKSDVKQGNQTVHSECDNHSICVSEWANFSKHVFKVFTSM